VTDSAGDDGPLLIERRFLDQADCDRLQTAMDRGARETAEIVGDDIVTEEMVRRTESIEIDVAVRQWFEQRLDAIKPILATRLRRRLGVREGTGFLRYAPGGFYRTHRDRGQVAGWPGAARRAVSVVVFLNGARSGNGDGGFEGGHLCLYPAGGQRAIDILPESGLLVAFRAETLHEVLLVRAGHRDAAVDWFYEG
jgi:predicted 2-oxoglutarate/Fe(II)-dependent dioxygenase YbiX